MLCCNIPVDKVTGGPRLSIGLIVFNGENFLAEALDSLLAQTYTDFELVLSDNGSDDATESICRHYAARDGRIRYYRSDINRGATWNHNRVVELARGELFKLAAHDDAYEPNFLDQCIVALDRRAEAVLAYTRTLMMMHGDRNSLQLYRDRVATCSPSAVIRFRDLLHTHIPNFRLFGVMRMAALRRAGPFGAYNASDNVVTLRLALQGPFVEVPEPLFLYRWHDAQASQMLHEPGSFTCWWDPSRDGARIFPHWRLLAEYLRAVLGLPLGARDRLRCLLEIGRWAARRLGRFAGELAGRVSTPTAVAREK